MSQIPKPNLYIIYSLFYTKNGEDIIIGGIQNYILGLIEVFHQDFNIKIIQKSSKNFKIESDKYNVYGFKLKGNKVGKELHDNIRFELKENDYLVWASDRISCKTKHKKTISIQHGITFDFIDYQNIKIGKILKKSLLLSIVYRQFQYFNAIRFFLNSSKVVCVDYNFLNWVRTILPRKLTQRAFVITNYSKIPDLKLTKSNDIKILFARRFVDYRGVYLMVELVKQISKKYDNVSFGIYGEGPLEKYIQQELGGYDNVLISKFSTKDSTKIPLEYNISIIPTIASEGTSLSLIESMACGCVPIASNVGGMTNVVLDSYNGFLVNPDSTEFINKLEYLILNPQELNRMSINSRETIIHSFSFKKWKNEWLEVFKFQ